MRLVTTAAAASLVLTQLPHALAADPTAAEVGDTAGTAVIGEVYGGGGNSGAALTRDFVELGNPGTGALDLVGHSVQYLPGSPSASSRWQVTPLNGTLEPGARHLVAQAAGTGGTVELPTPDTTGSINMSATTGTVALVAGTAELTCRTAADCAADERIVDLVGYGTAVVREGSGPAAGASNTASVARDADLTDTDDNAADLAAGAPTPVNSAGEGPATGGGDDGEEPPTEPGDVRIRDIQGDTRISPLVGTTVSAVPGVVTAVRATGARGFWVQDPEPDTDPRTSEGVFVHTGSTVPTVSPGDSVLVGGQVVEYRPASATQTLTEITSPTVAVLSSGNPLPAPVVLDADSVPDLYAPEAAGGSVEELKLDPGAYALDLYESLEGMLVEVSDTRIVGRTTEYDELWVTVKPEENPSVRGGTVYGSYEEPNTGRLKVMSLDPAAPLPEADVGDELTGTTTGPLDYARYGGYTLMAAELGGHVDNGLEREVTRPQQERELAIATYNVENLSPLDDDAKFARLAEGVVVNLAGPDILTLEEIQDNTGPTDDGVTASDETLRLFIEAIEAAGGPVYEWRSIDPEDKRDGGQPGGNIRNVLLFNPERVEFVDRPGGDATTAVEAVAADGGVELSVSPGRIEPNDSAWASSRKPLIGEFRFEGQTFFVVANHFNSKGGDEPLHGRNQPPNRTSESQRHRQATLVNGFVRDLLAVDPDANVVVAGDFNDFEFSETWSILTSGGALNNLMLTLPPEERYTYVFDGNSQTLDGILTSPAIRGFDYEPVRVNAEFADQASDHDPQIVRVDSTRSGGGDDGKGPGKGDGKGKAKEVVREVIRGIIDFLGNLLGRLTGR
ncbi:endonuclease/exonuclease/phosphatase family protein [Streptomyces sp. ST2-7A]|uniref:endonuclease/exonuclease/phosphatase family protein n=1 Tax=Streptomyces sp. ST2-7A TaxID=2907214 RepID=UPI001F38FB3E|nr:endonuclease/exonuclease/phosphatase family protein [Streptomyces sp. ST2-7A]MCE7080613.1 endonuclease/exonuclease/phosphatase family protein [Streptomyces sp. ST2-7A]